MKLINSLLIIVFVFSGFMFSSCAFDVQRFDAKDFDAKIYKQADNETVILPKDVKPKTYPPAYFETSVNYAKAWAKINERKEKVRIELMLEAQRKEKELAEKQAEEEKSIKDKETIIIHHYDCRDCDSEYVLPGWWLYYYGPNTGHRKYMRQYDDQNKRTTQQSGTITYPYRGIYSQKKWSAAPGSTDRPYRTYK